MLVGALLVEKTILGLIPGGAGPLYVEFACSPWVQGGFLHMLWSPTTTTIKTCMWELSDESECSWMFTGTLCAVRNLNGNAL